MKKEKKLQRIGTHRDGKNGGGGWKKRFYRARTEEDCTTGLFLGKSSRQSATKLARMCEFSTARPRFWRKRASKFREHVRKT